VDSHSDSELRKQVEEEEDELSVSRSNDDLRPVVIISPAARPQNLNRELFNFRI
jgi:hypothetical protein